MGKKRTVLGSVLFLILVALFAFGVPDINAAGTGWTFIDGDGANGLNINPATTTDRVSAVALGNDLYVAWPEPSGVTRIRVKKFSGDTCAWTSLDRDATKGMNRGTYGAGNPSLAVCNNEVYLAWYEHNGSYDLVYVEKYSPTTNSWTAVDGGSINRNIFSAGSPTMTVYNGKLYIAWTEYNASLIDQLHVKRYDGGTSWAFVDTGTDAGLNYDTGKNVNYPSLGANGDGLFLAWSERDASGNYELRVKKYNGSWASYASQNSAPANKAYSPALMGYGGSMYCSWYEQYQEGINTKFKIVTRRFAGGSWSDVSGGSSPSISSTSAYSPSFATDGTNLYLAFDEGGPTQIRAMKFDGSNWSFIDCGQSLNKDTSKGAYSSVPVTAGGNLYAAWVENGKVRARKYTPMTISSSTSLLEENLDTACIDVTLAGTTFRDAALSSANFVLLNAPAGLTVESVSYTDTSHCTVNLAYTGANIASNANVGIKILAAEVFLNGDLVSANDLAVTAQNPPSVAVKPISDITATSCTLNGEVVSSGNAAITERGFEYKKESDPSYTVVAAGSGTGAFSAGISGLVMQTRYLVRAYAVNREGKSYSEEISFYAGGFTLALVPSADVYKTDTTLFAIDASGAPYYYSNHTSYVGNFIGSIDETALKFDLSAVNHSWKILGVTLKIYVTEIYNGPTYTGPWPIVNVNGSTDDSWTDNPSSPSYPGTMGTVLLSGQSISAYGWKELSSTDLTNFIKNQFLGDDTATFVLTGASVAEAADTDFGFYCKEHTDAAFRPVLVIQYIIVTPPTVSTNTSVTGITSTGAAVGGNVASDGGATVTERGIEYKRAADTVYTVVPAPAAGLGAYSVNLSGLTPNTAYDARAYATNSEDTSRGDVVSFTTYPVPVVTGIDPASGRETGGTSVTITGTGFLGATAVQFGATAAAGFTVASSTSITAISPAGSGTVDVTVTTPGGTSATVANDRFTYLPTFTVTYDGNGHTGASVPIDGGHYIEGETITLRENTGGLVKTGHSFAGWNTQADGNGTSYAAGSAFTMGAADVILYAEWDINRYTVTFNSNGGSAVDSQSVNYNATASEPAAPTRIGYAFDGWYGDSGLTTAFSFTSLITAEITLYAKWIDIAPPTVTITTVAGNPTNLAPIPVVITFSEAVTGFTVDDIIVGNGIKNGFAVISGSNYTVNIIPSGQGLVTVDVAAGAAQDAAGNGNTAAAQLSRTYDGLPPGGYSVNIDQSYINNNNKTAMTFTFAGAEVGATYHYDLTSSGGGGPLNDSGTIDSATHQVTGVTTFGLNEGTLTLSVTVTDTAGNTGTAATDTVLKDTLMPSGYGVAITQSYINNANMTALSLTFSGAETGAEYSYTIASTGGGTNVVGSGTAGGASGTVPGIDVSGLNDGTLNLSFTMTDVAGNPGLPVTDTVTKDTAAPGVTISTTAENPTPLVPIPVTITFGKSVTGFTVGDITVTNGKAGNFSGGGTGYSVEITPYAQGTVTISIAAGVAQDAAGNGNTAAEPMGLTFAPQAEPVTGLNLTQDSGTVHLSWTNPGSNWDWTRVVRKSGGVPASPTDGTLLYQGTNDGTYDLDLPAGTYYYAVFGSYYGAYAASATGSITISTAGLRIHQTYQPGDGGTYSTLQTAQSWRGTSHTAWNGTELTLGYGTSGAQSGVWLKYPDLTGSLTGQIPASARIVDARLVLHLKEYASTTDLDTPYTIKIYRVPEATGMGAPRFGTADGLRMGLDWSYRDHRLGMNRPWATGASDILAALSSAELIDTIEFIPEICTDEGCAELLFDVTAALKAWVGDSETAKENQGFFLVLEGGSAGDLAVFDGTDATENQPLLEVVYGTDSGADLTGPATPITNLAAVPGTGQVALSWTNPATDFAGTRIVRRLGRTPSNAYDGDLVYNGTAETYTDTGLTDGTVYYYAAFAYDSNHNHSAKAWLKALPGTLAAPGSFTATAHTGYVSLAWSAATGADSYRIYRSDGAETRSMDVTGTSYDDWHVTVTTYTYYVVGVNSLGEGRSSAEATATPLADTLTPIAPGGLSADTVTNTTITLTWTDNADNETGYVIERSANSGGTWTERGTVGFDVTSFTDTGLTPGATYRFRVKAVRGAQSSGWVETGDVATTAAPLAPTNLTWTVISAGRVNLAWTDTATNETGYRVDICNTGGTILRFVELGCNTTSYSVTGLNPGVGYIFKVSAVNGTLEGTSQTEVVTTGVDPKGDLF